MNKKQIQSTVAASAAHQPKATMEEQLSDAQHKAEELGIEIGQVMEVERVDKMFACANADVVSIDEETNKKLVRKIDWYVLPWSRVLYVLQYFDKGV